MSLELEEHYNRIFKYCYFKTGSKDMAEDLTQETFLKFFSQKTYINHGKQLAYLYTIARNLCIDGYKGVNHLPLEEHDLVSNNIADFESSLCLVEALGKITPELQEIVMLRFINNLKPSSIGKILGISRFSVYRKINKALANLKELLREEDAV